MRDAMKAALKPNTRMIWAETPTNPMLKLVDLAKVAAFAKKHGLILVVDNTFCSPMLQRPLEFGAIWCCIRRPNTSTAIPTWSAASWLPAARSWPSRWAFLQNSVGAVAGPFDSFLAMRGLKTLHLRMKAHCESALELAHGWKNIPRSSG
jgi:cystathionine gamma-lyase